MSRIATSEPVAASPWQLLSLRPSGGHDSLRRAAARRGGRLLAASPWRLQPRGDADAARALDAALAMAAVIFTSPAAVAAADALRPLSRQPARTWLAVGAGTARALRARGIAQVRYPGRMDSEGLLALPELARPGRIGLVTAPGGRGLLAAELQRHGAEVVRADVYERVVVALAPATLARLRDLPPASVLALSSGEALEHLLAQLPADLRLRLQQLPVAAASDRLARLARAAGFARAAAARGPLPAQLVAAACALLADRAPCA
ncbi:uroporphyrinogen-III synthase [Stenotrophomonas sp. MMGLT7]|uniref:uroporphyrinogen-III synthase n=1 Tax=Stenotrophomonas sp. MMGLT7 TaxID=2901227 RepID=UPI001E3207AC|nr:uroporphyrinogen-III synthase [Stenotrophomonas sp. MMGLT7]MCD7099896.1 uroporphyrinogen-III synthase [Stenotrophomonas sp. MMGLT7]